MEWKEAVNQACREYLQRLPESIAHNTMRFELIAKTYRSTHGAKAGTTELNQQAAVGAASRLVANIKALNISPPRDDGTWPARYWPDWRGAARFPYLCQDREPIGNEYLFTQCVWNTVAGAYGCDVIMCRACELFTGLKCDKIRLPYEASGIAFLAPPPTARKDSVCELT